MIKSFFLRTKKKLIEMMIEMMFEIKKKKKEQSKVNVDRVVSIKKMN